MSSVLMCSVYYALGCILILDFVVTNLFLHSLPGMILLFLATPLKVFLHEISFTGEKLIEM